ncbi:hypothetical protein AtNW77_Chr4g0289041 [Arabidopsis thaliana]
MFSIKKLSPPLPKITCFSGFFSIGSEVSLLSFFSFDFFLFWYDLNHIFFQWFKI